MKAKFTQGEWEVLTNRPAKEINNIVRMNRAIKNKYDAVPYICIGGFPDTDPKEEIEANAHLIASAPSMYKALLALSKGEGLEPGTTIEKILLKARGEDNE